MIEILYSLFRLGEINFLSVYYSLATIPNRLAYGGSFIEMKPLFVVPLNTMFYVASFPYAFYMVHTFRFSARVVLG